MNKGYYILHLFIATKKQIHSNEYNLLSSYILFKILQKLNYKMCVHLAKLKLPTVIRGDNNVYENIYPCEYHGTYYR